MGPVEINGEFVRKFSQKEVNGWFYGLSTEVEIHPRLELLGEIHGEQNGSAPVELIVNFGMRPKLTRQLVLLLSVGKAVHGISYDRPNPRVYLGLQLNLLHQYEFSSGYPRPQRRNWSGQNPIPLLAFLHANPVLYNATSFAQAFSASGLL